MYVTTVCDDYEKGLMTITGCSTVDIEQISTTIFVGTPVSVGVQRSPTTIFAIGITVGVAVPIMVVVCSVILFCRHKSKRITNKNTE